MGVAAVAVVLGIPALAFTLWPLFRPRAAGQGLLAVPPTPREQLLERKRQLLRGLREIEFEHDAGHLSDQDHDELRARHEAEAADVLTELDRLGEPSAAEKAPSAEGRPSRGWRRPVALTTGALALLGFGIGIGAGIVRYTAPEPMAGVAPIGSRPLATLEPPTTAGERGATPLSAVPGPGGPSAGPPPGQSGPPRPLSPEALRGMLSAARTSLFEGRYSEAVAAYQAILKREPKNVDAMTHLGLIVALGGHIDAALGAFERALEIDPNYPPALLYRGQVLQEGKHDTEGAIRSWEKFLAVVPAGDDHDRVKRLIDDARSGK
jgi:tetratricopeptide (TPR) repeat protein